MAPNLPLCSATWHYTPISSQNGIWYSVNTFCFVTENWGRCNFGQNVTIMCDKLPVNIACGGFSVSVNLVLNGNIFPYSILGQWPVKLCSISEQPEIQFQRQGVGQGSNGPHGGLLQLDKAIGGEQSVIATLV